VDGQAQTGRDEGDESDERALVARLKQGDRRAFDLVYDRYRSRLAGFLLRLTRRRDLAEELLQETWIRLATHAPRLADDTRFAPWLFTVARNLFRSQRRYSLDALFEGRLGGPSVEAIERTSPFDLASASELERRLELALARLPTKYREVLLLVAVERLDPADAAGALGLRPDALRQRLARARGMIAKELERMERRPSREGALG
jgi:RNA polymerase sigma-70 factor (ECF subfamily)